MTQIAEHTKVIAADDTLSTTLDDESVILHTGSNKYFGFNTVGTDIWELLEQPHSISEITQHIAAEYDVSQERCRSDIDELIEELMDKELVHVCED